MNILKFKHFVGPKEWKFKDPDTKFQYKALTAEALYAHIRSYRQQNNLPPIEFLEAVIEHYLCLQKENVGMCARSGTLKRGVIQYIKGGIALLRNLAYNSFVSQEVADSRAAQCKDCKFNFFPDKDGFLKWADSLAEETVGDRKSKYHDDIGTCEACGCPLRCKVFYGGKINLTPGEEEKMQEVNCWQLKEKNGN